MSSPADAAHPRDHNKPPVVIPKEEEMLEHLQNRYPEIPAKLKEFEDAFKGYPAKLTLDQPDVAEAYQDLLAQVGKEQKIWSKVLKPTEKGPIDKIVKVVTNFFTKADEAADALLATYKPKYDDYIEAKKQENVRKQEAEAERLRQIEADNRARAEAAEKDRLAKEAAAEAARKAEQEALEKAAKAEQEKKDAEARAAAAQAEEKRLAEEKRARDRAEKERNTNGIRDIKAYMKTAERIHAQADEGEANDAELEHLDTLIKHGGTISHVAGPISVSPLLDEEQAKYMGETKEKLAVMRAALDERLNKRERDKREKARLLAEEQEKKLAAERKVLADAEAAKLEEAKKTRALEEAAADKAKAERAQAQAEAKAAGADAKTAESGAKVLGREVRAASEDADRAENRADRAENRLEKSTDADLSRTRGVLGSQGRQQRRWEHIITDAAALHDAIIKQCQSPVMAVLLAQLEEPDLNGAVFRYMRLHQDGWKMRGRTRVDDALPGVVFAYELDTVVAG